MSEVAFPIRRPRGRPRVRSDEETRRVIAEAARRAFAANGDAGTSMDAVAKAAGVSKKTLYRLVPTKADLFKASFVERIERFILAIDEKGLSALPVAAALERILTEYGLLTLSAESVALHRLVIAESDRFPELAVDFYRHGVAATQGVLVRTLDGQRRAGRLGIEDALDAAGMLRGMMVMEPQRAALLAGEPVPSPAAIAARARRCVRLFLKGCGLPA